MKNKGFIVVFSGLLALASCGGGAQKKAEVETPPVEEVKPEVRDTFPSDKWMEENKQKEGVVEADGIQYKVLQEGTGVKPNRRKRVKINFELRTYEGKLVESHMGKDVVDLFVSNLIPGMQNALVMMPEGSTWEVYVPWRLGYGEEGAKNIPPHSALIFKIKLIEVAK
ncbi:MAG: FKBP-type peptidyl-prolyl cis-trans isomerase [Prevotella sp.]|nr:FKBP-type peptidyl-prolyl cis-trans isomerase [Prevotella sp.]